MLRTENVKITFSYSWVLHGSYLPVMPCSTSKRSFHRPLTQPLKFGMHSAFAGLMGMQDLDKECVGAARTIYLGTVQNSLYNMANGKR